MDSMDEYWEMLTEDQIDFGELPITTLKKLVYSADPFIATGALAELVARDKTEALTSFKPPGLLPINRLNPTRGLVEFYRKAFPSPLMGLRIYLYI